MENSRSKSIALVHYRLLQMGGLETRFMNYIRIFHHMGFSITLYCAIIEPDIILPKEVNFIKIPLGITPKHLRRLVFAYKVAKKMKPLNFYFSLSLERTWGQHAVLCPSNHRGFIKATKRSGWRIRDLVQKHLDKNTFTKNNIIIAASEKMKEELIHFYNIPSEKIHINYPPLNAQKFVVCNKQNSMKLQKEEKKGLKFLFVSTSHKRKGIALLYKVFEMLPDKYHLYIAGKPATKNTRNITYVGYHEKLHEIYSTMDFLIHPAIYEPFGQIVSESLACGTPVIISEEVGAKTIVKPQYGKIIKGFDANIWADVLRNLDLKDFSVPEYFCKENKLSAEEHVQRILKLWAELRSKDVEN